MKLTTFLIIALSATAFSQKKSAEPEAPAAEKPTVEAPAAEKPAAEKPAADPAIPAWQNEFTNLPIEKRREYFELAQSADSLFKEKRIFECLDTLAKLNLIFSGNPATLNLEGACYVEFRDFDKARATFQKSLAQSPDNTNVKFNLAEVDFVTHNWQASLDGFTPIMDDIKKADMGMYNLVLYKVALCYIKLDKLDEAKKLIAPYDFLDDTPLFYFGQAALSYEQGKTQEAESWLARAARVFNNAEILAPWQDTLIEFGYIKSFYGGDLEEDNQTLPGLEPADPNP